MDENSPPVSPLVSHPSGKTLEQLLSASPSPHSKLSAVRLSLRPSAPLSSINVCSPRMKDVEHSHFAVIEAQKDFALPTAPSTTAPRSVAAASSGFESCASATTETSPSPPALHALASNEAAHSLSPSAARIVDDSPPCVPRASASAAAHAATARAPPISKTSLALRLDSLIAGSTSPRLDSFRSAKTTARTQRSRYCGSTPPPRLTTCSVPLSASRGPSCQSACSTVVGEHTAHSTHGLGDEHRPMSSILIPSSPTARSAHLLSPRDAAATSRSPSQAMSSVLALSAGLRRVARESASARASRARASEQGDSRAPSTCVASEVRDVGRVEENVNGDAHDSIEGLGSITVRGAVPLLERFATEHLEARFADLESGATCCITHDEGTPSSSSSGTSSSASSYGSPLVAGTAVASATEQTSVCHRPSEDFVDVAQGGEGGGLCPARPTGTTRSTVSSVGLEDETAMALPRTVDVAEAMELEPTTSSSPPVTGTHSTVRCVVRCGSASTAAPSPRQPEQSLRTHEGFVRPRAVSMRSSERSSFRSASDRGSSFSVSKVCEATAHLHTSGGCGGGSMVAMAVGVSNPLGSHGTFVGAVATRISPSVCRGHSHSACEPGSRSRAASASNIGGGQVCYLASRVWDGASGTGSGSSLSRAPTKANVMGMAVDDHTATEHPVAVTEALDESTLSEKDHCEVHDMAPSQGNSMKACGGTGIDESEEGEHVQYDTQLAVSRGVAAQDALSQLEDADDASARDAAATAGGAEANRALRQSAESITLEPTHSVAVETHHGGFEYTSDGTPLPPSPPLSPAAAAGRREPPTHHIHSDLAVHSSSRRCSSNAQRAPSFAPAVRAAASVSHCAVLVDGVRAGSRCGSLVAVLPHRRSVSLPPQGTGWWLCSDIGTSPPTTVRAPPRVIEDGGCEDAPTGGSLDIPDPHAALLTHLFDTPTGGVAQFCTERWLLSLPPPGARGSTGCGGGSGAELAHPSLPAFGNRWIAGGVAAVSVCPPSVAVPSARRADLHFHNTPTEGEMSSRPSCHLLPPHNDYPPTPHEAASAAAVPRGARHACDVEGSTSPPPRSAVVPIYVSTNGMPFGLTSSTHAHPHHLATGSLPPATQGAMQGGGGEDSAATRPEGLRPVAPLRLPQIPSCLPPFPLWGDVGVQRPAQRQSSSSSSTSSPGGAGESHSVAPGSGTEMNLPPSAAPPRAPPQPRDGSSSLPPRRTASERPSRRPSFPLGVFTLPSHRSMDGDGGGGTAFSEAAISWVNAPLSARSFAPMRVVVVPPSRHSVGGGRESHLGGGMGSTIFSRRSGSSALTDPWPGRHGTGVLTLHGPSVIAPTPRLFPTPPLHGPSTVSTPAPQPLSALQQDDGNDDHTHPAASSGHAIAMRRPPAVSGAEGEGEAAAQHSHRSHDSDRPCAPSVMVPHPSQASPVQSTSPRRCAGALGRLGALVAGGSRVIAPSRGGSASRASSVSAVNPRVAPSAPLGEGVGIGGVVRSLERVRSTSKSAAEDAVARLRHTALRKESARSAAAAAESAAAAAAGASAATQVDCTGGGAANGRRAGTAAARSPSLPPPARSFVLPPHTTDPETSPCVGRSRQGDVAVSAGSGPFPMGLDVERLRIFCESAAAAAVMPSLLVGVPPPALTPPDGFSRPLISPRGGGNSNPVGPLIPALGLGCMALSPHSRDGRDLPSTRVHGVPTLTLPSSEYATSISVGQTNRTACVSHTVESTASSISRTSSSTDSLIRDGGLEGSGEAVPLSARTPANAVSALHMANASGVTAVLDVSRCEADLRARSVDSVSGGPSLATASVAPSIREGPPTLFPHGSVTYGAGRAFVQQQQPGEGSPLPCHADHSSLPGQPNLMDDAYPTAPPLSARPRHPQPTHSCAYGGSHRCDGPNTVCRAPHSVDGGSVVATPQMTYLRVPGPSSRGGVESSPVGNGTVAATFHATSCTSTMSAITPAHGARESSIDVPLKGTLTSTTDSHSVDSRCSPSGGIVGDENGTMFAPINTADEAVGDSTGDDVSAAVPQLWVERPSGVWRAEASEAAITAELVRKLREQHEGSRTTERVRNTSPPRQPRRILDPSRPVGVGVLVTPRTSATPSASTALSDSAVRAAWPAPPSSAARAAADFAECAAASVQMIPPPAPAALAFEMAPEAASKVSDAPVVPMSVRGLVSPPRTTSGRALKARTVVTHNRMSAGGAWHEAALERAAAALCGRSCTVTAVSAATAVSTAGSWWHAEDASAKIPSAPPTPPHEPATVDATPARSEGRSEAPPLYETALGGCMDDLPSPHLPPPPTTAAGSVAATCVTAFEGSAAASIAAAGVSSASATAAASVISTRALHAAAMPYAFSSGAATSRAATRTAASVVSRDLGANTRSAGTTESLMHFNARLMHRGRGGMADSTAAISPARSVVGGLEVVGGRSAPAPPSYWAATPNPPGVPTGPTSGPSTTAATGGRLATEANVVMLKPLHASRVRVTTTSDGTTALTKVGAKKVKKTKKGAKTTAAASRKAC